MKLPSPSHSKFFQSLLEEDDWGELLDAEEFLGPHVFSSRTEVCALMLSSIPLIHVEYLILIGQMLMLMLISYNSSSYSSSGCNRDHRFIHYKCAHSNTSSTVRNRKL